MNITMGFTGDINGTEKAGIGYDATSDSIVAFKKNGDTYSNANFKCLKINNSTVHSITIPEGNRLKFTLESDGVGKLEIQ